jgi:hypothetical protein
MTTADSGSYRDRRSRILAGDAGAAGASEVLRVFSPRGWEEWRALAATSLLARLQVEGSLVGAREVAVPEGASELLPGGVAGALAHPRLPFVSYPYEWSFGMLRRAALLQLDVLLAALGEGLTLKDASPYNVQWRGRQPVFIDIGSFERRVPGDPWVGYLQFCQLFLYPLLLAARRDVRYHAWLRGSLEGITPDECRRLLRPRDLLRRGALVDVWLQSLLAARAGDDDASVRREIRRSGLSTEMIVRNVRRLRRVVEGLRWRRTASTWSGYTGLGHYGGADRAAKRALVERAAARRPRRLVWDLGANTGEHACLVAPHAELVVAMDRDHLAVDLLYRRLAAEGPANVLPLVVDLLDPSPGIGWRLRERLPLADRGRPDLVLALALVHHLVLTGNVPVADLVDWLADLGAVVVVELVTNDDPMAQRLLRNKHDDDLYYTVESFERCLAPRFTTVERLALCSGTRILYALEARR